MKGTGVAMAAGLAALVGLGAAGGAWLVERALAEEATRVLASEGVNATVSFSGRTAKVNSDPAQLPRALSLVLNVAGVAHVEAGAPLTVPTASGQPGTPAPGTSTAIPSSVQATGEATTIPSPSALPTAMLTPTPTATPTPMPKVVVQFEGGASSFRSDQSGKIGEVAAWLKANPTVVVEVIGHTDNGRTGEFRRQLATQRAKRVVDALVAAGVSGEQLVVVAKAEAEPIASNDSAEGRAENRRVTFVQRGER